MTTFAFPYVSYLLYGSTHPYQTAWMMHWSQGVFVVDFALFKTVMLQMWDSGEMVPHEVSSKVYQRINFKLHIYFVVRKISSGKMTVSDCLAEVREFSSSTRTVFDCLAVA